MSTYNASSITVLEGLAATYLAKLPPNPWIRRAERFTGLLVVLTGIAILVAWLVLLLQQKSGH